jgi:hypothetical protein
MGVISKERGLVRFFEQRASDRILLLWFAKDSRMYLIGAGKRGGFRNEAANIKTKSSALVEFCISKMLCISSLLLNS